MARAATVNGHIPFNVQVGMGLIPGWSIVIVVGHDESAAQANAVLSPGNATGIIAHTPVILTTPAVLIVSSTSQTKDIAAGVGANTVLLTGLDANGDIQTETVTLHASDGRTGVTTSSTWSAINDVKVASTGAELDNDGTIWVGTGALTAGVPAVGYASMEPGKNHALTGTFTVPLNHAFYIESAELSGDGANAFKGMDFEISIYSAALAKSIELFSVHLGDGGFGDFGPPFPVIPELTQIHIHGGTIAQTGSLSGRITGYLRDLSHNHSWGP